MSATTAGAVKAYVESLGLQLPAFRDRAPEGTKTPFLTILEGIVVTPERHGDLGDPDADQAVTEMVQVDLWQQLRDQRTGETTEDYQLPGQLQTKLHGARLLPSGSGAPPTTVYGVLVASVRRLPDPDRNTVHHVFTLNVKRRA